MGPRFTGAVWYPKSLPARRITLGIHPRTHRAHRDSRPGAGRAYRGTLVIRTPHCTGKAATRPVKSKPLMAPVPLMMTLKQASAPSHGLSTTIAWHDGELRYALEGNITHTGSGWHGSRAC